MSQNKQSVGPPRFHWFMLNLALGVGVLACFYPVKESVDLLADSFDGLIQWLRSLIDWLMGHPGGLKLNGPLNRVMGSFFLYHIYLWQTYITFLRPFLLGNLIVIRWSGLVGGLILQMALLSDLLSLLTLHILCFHIYAARLYQLQLAGVLSLWRLFRGRKWNPLRQRVDSMEYETEQLVLGTLLFAILLFLLPTTLLYYVVFTTLRLIPLAMKKVGTFLSICLEQKIKPLHGSRPIFSVTGTDIWNFVSSLIHGTVL